MGLKDEWTKVSSKSNTRVFLLDMISSLDMGGKRYLAGGEPLDCNWTTEEAVLLVRGERRWTMRAQQGVAVV